MRKQKMKCKCQIFKNFKQASTALAVYQDSLIQSLYNDFKTDGGLAKTISYKVPYHTSDRHRMTACSFEYQTITFSAIRKFFKQEKSEFQQF